MDRLQTFWDSLTELVSNPTANLTASVLLLAVVTIVLLIAVVAVLLWLATSSAPKAPKKSVPPEHRVQVDAPVAPKAPTWFGRASPALIVLLLVASAVASFVATGTDDYCLSCHEAVGIAIAEGESGLSGDQVSAGSHTGVSCVGCHEDPPLPLGFIGGSFARVSHAINGYAGAEVLVAPVGSRACLSCHDTVLDDVLTNDDRGIVVSHLEPVEAGMTCTECHSDLAHTADVAFVPGMATCVRCHDGNEVSSECDLCHTGDSALASESRPFPPQRLAKVTDCGGCHPQDTCDDCHGLRMPHASDFEMYEHARYAGFDKKVLCWRCHTLADCSKCHQVKPVGTWGHGDDDSWKIGHQMRGHPDPGGCGCHIAHPAVRDQGNFCIACH